MDLCGHDVVIVGVHFSGKEDVEIEAVDERDFTFEEGEVADQVVLAAAGDNIGLIDLRLQPGALLVCCGHFLLARENVEQMLTL